MHLLNIDSFFITMKPHLRGVRLQYLIIDKKIGVVMTEIRWHSRAGQGAVTGAKGLGDVVATNLGKYAPGVMALVWASCKGGGGLAIGNALQTRIWLD